MLLNPTRVRLPALETPSVSIVICNYNYARFLEQAIESALAQTYPCQVVVVDDGSTDHSRELLPRWRDRATIVCQRNQGQRAAYQTGFEHAQSDVLIFLDADDYLDRTAAATIAESFAEGIAKVHYRLRLVDEHDRALGTTIPSRMRRGDARSSLVEHGLLYASAPGSGNAYRRDVVAELLPLPCTPHDRHGADFFLIYGSALAGEVRAIEQVLGAYRVQQPQLNASEFVFGNAAATADPALRFLRRTEQLRAWIAARSGGTVVLPRRLLEFSQSKITFARAIFDGPYGQGLRRGGEELPRLLKSLWWDPDFSLAQKGTVTTWALCVLLGPRALGRPLARYVANPARRGAAREGLAAA